MHKNKTNKLSLLMKSSVAFLAVFGAFYVFYAQGYHFCVFVYSSISHLLGQDQLWFSRFLLVTASFFIIILSALICGHICVAVANQFLTNFVLLTPLSKRIHINKTTQLPIWGKWYK